MTNTLWNTTYRWKKEADEASKLNYLLLLNPLVDTLSVAQINQKTTKDITLLKLRKENVGYPRNQINSYINLNLYLVKSQF